MPAKTSTRSRRPAREQTAYDAGRSGEPMPGWVEDDPRLIAAWEDGAADLEVDQLAAADADPQPTTLAQPQRRRTRKAPTTAADDPSTTQSSGDNTSATGSSVSNLAANAIDWRATGRWLRDRPGVSDASGFLLGLVGFALFRSYLAGGWDGVRGWLAAKFLNRPAPTARATPLTPASPDNTVVPYDEAMRRFRAGERAASGG